MNALGRILFFWFALALVMLLASVSAAQTPSPAIPLPEGIAATGDTTEVRALTEWADRQWQTYPEEARQAAERALMLAQNLNDQQGIGTSLTIVGNLAPDLEEKEAYYVAAQEAYEQIGDEGGLYRIRTNMGTIYRLRGDPEQALTFYLEALRGFERLGDDLGRARVLNSIGNLHVNQDNLDEALASYGQAAGLMEMLDDAILTVNVLNNFGNAHVRAGSYESAEIHLRRTLAIAEERGFQGYVAVISSNLGFLFNEQGHYEEALPFLLAAENGIERDMLFAVYNELAGAYMGLDQYDPALHYATESLRLARETGTAFDQMQVHLTLSWIHEEAGNDRQALTHYRRYATARDSMYTAERAEIITELQTRYETEEKQRAIERLEQQNQIQTLRQALLLAGVGGLLLILGILYYRYRVKQRANHLLEELDTARSRFFANISHEFRTPLTVILGALQDGLAGRFGSLPERLAGRDHVMLRNTRQLQRLIDEVLDLNRLESGHLELGLTPGDLAQSLRHIVEASAPLAERKGITLTLACNVESCLRLYDEEKLEKIVGNLLSNALKFTSRGGSVRVDLRCTDQIEISVTDDGPGIPVEEQAKIFERFTQLDHGVLKGGTGIGLALVKELTELHGGTITLESTPGKGSMFSVRLPLERATIMALQEEKATVTAVIEEFEVGGDGYTNNPVFYEENTSEGDRTTVLIIEDNDDVRAYIRRSLEESYSVLEAVDGESGLRQAHDALPDLIVSDVMLPDFDGYEIARRLKAMPDTECIPVVMLTARAAEYDHVTGYTSGAEVYITKPFSAEALKAAVTRLLEERKRLWRRMQLRTNHEQEVEQTSPPTLLDRARVVVLENLHNENFGVDELASALGMTRRTLYRQLNPKVDPSPSTLIWSLRLERAHEFLSEGAGSISEIAYAVGFKSLSHFTRSFREHFGKPPSSVVNVNRH